jgi:hypothetical protein
MVDHEVLVCGWLHRTDGHVAGQWRSLMARARDARLGTGTRLAARRLHPLQKHTIRNWRTTSAASTSQLYFKLSSTHIMSAADLTSDVGEVASSAARRRSGRVSRKPEKLASAASPAGSAKRKRGDNDDSGVEADDASTDEQSDSSEGEPDEEELRERQRKRRGRAAPKRPAPKKPKTNGAPISLAMRPATNVSRKLTKRPRKAALRKSAVADEEPEGLYGRRPRVMR